MLTAKSIEARIRLVFKDIQYLKIFLDKVSTYRYSRINSNYYP